MESSSEDFTLSFRKLTQTRAHSSNGSEWDGAAHSVKLPDTWMQSWQSRIDKDQATNNNEAIDSSLEHMRHANPIYIPRNHRVEEAITAAVNGDFAPFDTLHGVLQNPFMEQSEYRHYEETPSADNAVTATFCGT